MEAVADIHTFIREATEVVQCPHSLTVGINAKQVMSGLTQTFIFITGYLPIG
jgi:hypothetical protein